MNIFGQFKLPVVGFPRNVVAAGAGEWPSTLSAVRSARCCSALTGEAMLTTEPPNLSMIGVGVWPLA